MNELIKLLKKKVPGEYKNSPEFALLLSIIKKEDINNLLALNSYFANEIKKYKRLLRENPSPTANTLRIKYAKWIDSLKEMRSIVRASTKR